MPVKTVYEKFRSRRPESTELPCSWCGSIVPLPEGEFSGVCIECGTVMFRGGMDADAACDYSSGSGITNKFIPSPAV